MSDNSTDAITRAELEGALDSVRRELSVHAVSQAALRAEINGKLDRILNSKTEEARQSGVLQEQIRNLQADTIENRTNLASLRQKQEEPRDAVIRFFLDLTKLAVAAAIGYFLRGR